MNVTITPGLLRGVITPPPSKSESHRRILGAALCAGVSRIENMAYSEDVEATIRCMQALGAEFVQEGESLTVTGLFHGGSAPHFVALPKLDCGESGSTLRFLLPVALAVAGGGVFTGHGRLLARPQKPYFALFAEQGIACEATAAALEVRGRLKPGAYRLPGDVSSQFFTGLLYALPLLDAPSHIVSTTPLESGSYLAMTRSILAEFGVDSRACPTADGDGPTFCVDAPTAFRCGVHRIGADWSNAAFWYAANALGSGLEIRGLRADAPQGDRVIAACARQLAKPGRVDFDVSDCPDLVPPLACMAALRAGETTCLTGALRLRIKESDRLATVSQTLNALGAQVTEGADRLTIHGAAQLKGGVVDGCNDHRIAMMAAVAATRATAPVTITGAECVRKSYPNFWQDFQALGGKIQ